MIRYIRLKNFRAYKDHTFDFSRLNIFIGANNSGKSSILSAINLIAQTSLETTGATSPLILNGRYEELGTYQDIVHGNNVRTPIGFDIGISEFDFSFEVKYRTQRREIEITKFSLSRNEAEIYSFIGRKDKNDVRLLKKPIESIINSRVLRRPRFFGFLPFQGDYSRFQYRDRELPEASLNILDQVSRSMRLGDMAFRDNFRNFDTLSPFRDQPKRTYLYTGETPKEVGRTGSNGVNLLVNDSSRRGSLKVGIEEEISRWLNANKIAKAIRVKNLTPRHFEICIIDFKNKEHNICDVGSGCSQVLPVLVGGLNLFGSGRSRQSGPLFVVQEPEIHLHPNAQASLGSYFVSLARHGGQQFIETHSDNLVLRIARHVALGEIKSQDVRLFFVEDREGDKVITDIEIDSKGVFNPSWPGGFFPQRQNESFELAKARTRPKKSLADGQLPLQYP